MNKIEVEDLRFRLHVKTEAGWISLPAVTREDNYDGEHGLSVFFSQVCGLIEHGYRLSVFAAGHTTQMTFPVVMDSDSYEFGECTDFLQVDLTQAQVESLVNTLTADMEQYAKQRAEQETNGETWKDHPPKIHAEYQEEDGQHCITVEYDYSVNDWMEYGVNPRHHLVTWCHGFMDDEDSFGGVTVFRGRVPNREMAERFLSHIDRQNQEIESAFKKYVAEEEAAAA